MLVLVLVLVLVTVSVLVLVTVSVSCFVSEIVLPAGWCAACSLVLPNHVPSGLGLSPGLLLPELAMLRVPLQGEPCLGYGVEVGGAPDVGESCVGGAEEDLVLFWGVEGP